jgi:hypothetical protein
MSHSGNFWLGPVDYSESQWHNACAPSDVKYPSLIQQLYGNYLMGLSNQLTLQNLSAGSGQLCDVCAELTANGVTLIAHVITYGDETGTNDIDVSPEARAALRGDTNYTLIWRFVTCPTTAPIYYTFDDRDWSNVWYFRVWIRNSRVPVNKVESSGTRASGLGLFAEFQREPLLHGAVHDFFDLVLGSQGHDFFGQLLRLAEPGRADDGLDHRDLARRHRQRAQAQPEQHPAESRIASHVAAHGDGLAAFVRGRDHRLDGAQDGRMQRVVKVAHVFVLAIGGQGVLDQVVGADGQELALVREKVGDDGRAGRFDHGAEGNVAIVLDAFLGQLVAHVGADLAHDAPLAHAGNEGKHDAQRTHRRGPIEGAQLRAEEIAPPQRIADRAQAEGRVVARGNAHRHGQLVAAQVEGPEDHAAAFHRLERRHGVLVLLFLGGQGRAFEVEELGAEQPHGVGAELDGNRNLLEQLDVGRQLDAHVVERGRGRLARLGQALGLHEIARRPIREALLDAEVGFEDDLAAPPSTMTVMPVRMCLMKS